MSLPERCENLHLPVIRLVLLVVVVESLRAVIRQLPKPLPNSNRITAAGLSPDPQSGPSLMTAICGGMGHSQHTHHHCQPHRKL